jgi:hypothetical protein
MGAQGESEQMELMEHKEKQEQMDQMGTRWSRNKWIRMGVTKVKQEQNGSAGATAAEPGSKWIWRSTRSRKQMELMDHKVTQEQMELTGAQGESGTQWNWWKAKVVRTDPDGAGPGEGSNGSDGAQGESGTNGILMEHMEKQGTNELQAPKVKQVLKVWQVLKVIKVM